jgi:hypothetical protein
LLVSAVQSCDWSSGWSLRKASGRSSGGQGSARRRRRTAWQGAAAPHGRRIQQPNGRRIHGGKDDPRSRAQAAVTRLARTNPPGKVSLAGLCTRLRGAGYGADGGDEPEWLAELDPLDTLFLGTVWPREFADGYEFANALTAWLGLLRETVQWAGSSGSSGRCWPLTAPQRGLDPDTALGICWPFPRSPTRLPWGNDHRNLGCAKVEGRRRWSDEFRRTLLIEGPRARCG